MKKIVIVGGGFAGVYAARALEHRLKNDDDVEILLFCRENYTVFQPMLAEVISGTIGLTDVVNPLRRMLKRTHVHVREVEAIDVANKTVTIAAGFRPHTHTESYDHLIIAPGTVTDFRGLPGLPEHALPFKNLADALELRSRVIRCLEEADVESDDPELRKQLLTFVVAGGGFSGVEVVAELNDFVRRVARLFRRIDPREIRVILAHAQDRILPEMKPKLGLFAQRILAKRGVELMLGHRLQAATRESAILASPTGPVSIPTKTLVSTIPAFPHPLIDSLDLPKSKNGRLLVARTLHIQGHVNLWALGDCASVPTKDGSPCPPTAQHATRQASLVAENIARCIEAEKRPAPVPPMLKTFDFKGLGKMGSLGPRSAVAEVFGLRLSGFAAWWLWRTVYLMKLPGWGRRLKVALDWTLDLVLPPDLVQLRLGGTRGLQREHYEQGQDVFRQGELGDRLYLILSGEVDVIREEGGESRTVARLGPGQWFGEMAILHMTIRSASVRCAAALDVLSLPREEFGVLAAHLPDLRQRFDALAAQRQSTSDVLPVRE
jgi:NADH dehydrogenase